MTNAVSANGKGGKWRPVRTLITAALAAGLLWFLFARVITNPRLALDYIRAILWPVVVVLILFALRAPLGEKLRELLKLEAFGAAAEFRERRTRQFAEELDGPIGALEATATDAEETPPDSVEQATDEGNGVASTSGDSNAIGDDVPPEASDSDSKPVVVTQTDDLGEDGRAQGPSQGAQEWEDRLEDLLSIGIALGVPGSVSTKMRRDLTKSPEETYKKVLRYMIVRAAAAHSKQDKAVHSRSETRDGIENIIRTSAAWGYDMARSGAPKTVPDVVWNSDNTWRIVTTIPNRKEDLSSDRVTPPTSGTAPGSRLRSIQALEDEIKKIEKGKHGPFSKSSLHALSGDNEWLMELKKRLRSIDAENPWAR
jgi:hypothetical protein